jgi:hypothetical protein
MPITYTVDPAQGIQSDRMTVVIWTGNISMEDLRQHWRAMFNDPEFRATNLSLADLRSVTSFPVGFDLHTVMDKTLKPLLAVRARRWAIVASTVDQHATARTFKVFVPEGTTLQIFRDYDTALAWLRE